VLGFHPHVRFSANPNNAFLFDIRTDCSNTLTCGGEGGGASVGLVDWETFFNGSQGPNFPTIAINMPSTIFIRVYRANGKPVTCDSWTLTISD